MKKLLAFAVFLVQKNSDEKMAWQLRVKWWWVGGGGADSKGDDRERNGNILRTLPFYVQCSV